MSYQIIKRLVVFTLLVVVTTSVRAVTSVNATNKYSYGANFGWMDWRGNTNAGAVIGEYVCSGYIYAANVGWISLGSGTPTNNIQYVNTAAADYGVNHDGLGNLRGYAYGANIGWINFENVGAPKVDLVTGKLSGSVYSANCGWISLSNAFAHVQTDFIAPGLDTDGDNLADAWEWLNFNTLTNGPSGDPDGDGFTNLQEYLAGTDPNDVGSNLIITLYDTTSTGSPATLTWTSVMTRQYRIQKTLSLTTPLWFDSGLGLIVPSGATTTRMFTDTNAPIRFYRVQAIKPLSP